MNIQLNTWQVRSLGLERAGAGDNIETKDTFELNVGTAFPENPEVHEFYKAFRINMTGQGFSLNLLMEFIFSTDCEITDDLKNSDFIKINAAAIAYPFLRSFVANLTLQAGYPSVILPTINFVSFFEEENRSNS